MDAAAIQQLKNQKAFKKGDIAVYAALLALIAVLFWVFVFNSRDESLTAIEVYHEDRATGDTLIFTYDFTSGTYSVNEQWRDKIDVQTAEGGITAKINVSGERYNILRILNKGEAYVSDANCSLRRDCTGFAHIIRSGMVTVCVPHNLKIIGVGGGSEPPDDPIIG